MQADPQKLDFRNDLLPRLPGPGGMGGMGGMGGLGALGGPMPPAHELARPGSLFAAAGTFFFFLLRLQMYHGRNCLREFI